MGLELIVMCGVSHSGKSTYVKKKYKNYTYINSDEIRKKITGTFAFTSKEDESKVWQEFFNKKIESIQNKKNIVLDACHLSSQSRWHALRGVPSTYNKVIVVMDVSKNEILKRVDKCKRIKKKYVLSMINDFKKPNHCEGFDEIIKVRN